jgi:Single-stranded DNA-specific exonuclease
VVAVNRVLRSRGFWTDARPEPDLLGWLDIVALGTVADVVPLKGLNRAFVAKGLLALRRRDNVGLTALMDVARLSGPPEPFHLGFLLGPRINAGGRIGRADLGSLLLRTDDPVEAGASPPSSTVSMASGAPWRLRCWRRRRPRPAPRSASRKRARWW